MKRMFLHAGESRNVSFTLQPEELATVDAEGRRAVEPGEYHLAVGGAQPRAGEPGMRFTVVGRFPLPQ